MKNTLKRNLLLTLILVSLSALFCGIATAQIGWNYRYEKKEYRCEICGKSVYANEQVHNGDYYTDNMFGGNYLGGEYIPDSLQVCSIPFDEKIEHVCVECKIKYEETITKELSAKWDAYWRKIKDANGKNRIKYDQLRKKKTAEELKIQIENLQGKLDEVTK
jgi:hypothetical protein